MSDVVLEFKAVDYKDTAEHIRSLEGVSFVLRPGELCVVRIDSDVEHAPVLDLCMGLARPQAGTILFEGRDWCGMDAFEEAAARGRMGCIFETPGWISSLTVIENIMLRERHHTQREDDEIRAEALGLAERVGVEDCYDIGLRPDKARARRLRVYEWVRACMGKPAVILMAFPERGAPSRYREPLLALLEYMAGQGSAIMLLTDAGNVLNHAKDAGWCVRDAESIFYG